MAIFKCSSCFFDYVFKLDLAMNPNTRQRLIGCLIRW